MHQKFLHVCLFTFSLSYAFAVCAQGAGRSAAEEPERPPPMIGPMGGVNFASISVEPAEGLNLRMNIRAIGGVALLLPIGASRNKVQIELAYIGKGVKNKWRLPCRSGDKVWETTVVDAISLDYLSLSPMLHLNMGRQLGFFLSIGPEAALLLDSRFTSSISTSYDTKDQYSDFDLSLKGGAGVNVQVTPRFIVQLNVTYGIGLMDILRAPDTDRTFRTQGLQVCAGYFVPLPAR